MAQRDLSNEELYRELLSHGITVGPVTDSTRGLYMNKLEKITRGQTQATTNRGKVASSSVSPSSNARKRRTTTKVTSGSDIIPGLGNFTSTTAIKQSPSRVKNNTKPRPSSHNRPPSPKRFSPLPRSEPRYSHRVSNFNPSLYEEPSSLMTPPLVTSRGGSDLHYIDDLREEEEESTTSSTSTLSAGVSRLFEGVKESVKQFVNKVSEVVDPLVQIGGGGKGEGGGRKRKASWLANESESDEDNDYYDGDPRSKYHKKVHISPSPSAPPMPPQRPPIASAPPMPQRPPMPQQRPPIPSAPPIHLAPPRPGLLSSPRPKLSSPSRGDPMSPSLSYDWELLPSDVSICRRPDGSQWILGKGGFGEVFKGLKDGVDEVAVKVIHIANNRSAINQFKSEIDLISKLRHKHILQFYGACIQQQSFLYMVTELMQSDLFTALRSDKRYMWTGPYGKEVLEGIASGLNYLHSRRPPVVHRDIKSPNVLLTDGIAKIADVGIARTKMESDMTAQRGFTIAWAAPEVVYRKRATEKIDIWSFGIILWEVVTGKPPGPGQLVLPVTSSRELKQLYSHCTKDDYTLRPSAAEILVTLKNMK